MYCKAWKYSVSSNHSLFEEAYGRNGEWFKFFESCDEFLGQEIMRSAEGTFYLVLEKWISIEDYEHFLSSNRDAFEAISSNTESLYEEKLNLGSYTVLQ
ncbi:MAG: hypothetical protein AAF616_09615 [Bacteroidota bacterium]